MAPLPPARSGDDSTADLTGVIRARRRQVWRKRLIAAGIVAALIAVVAVAWFSPLLSLQTVKVSGSDFVDDEAVSTFVLDTERGTPLPQVRPSEVEAAVLKKFPKVKEAAIHYGGPRSLKIKLTDRTPVLAIAGSSGFRLYDAEAVDLGVVDKAPKTLTVLEDSGHEVDQVTVSAVIRFLSNLRPELRRQLTTIEAKDEKSLQGKLDTGKHQATVVFGDAQNASLKVRTAAQLAAQGRTDIDVSVPSVPVTN